VLTDSLAFVTPLVLGSVLGLIAAAAGLLLRWVVLRRAREQADRLLADARQESETHKREALVAAQEKILAVEEEVEQRERELEGREAAFEARLRSQEQEQAALAERERDLERRLQELERQERAAADDREAARAAREAARLSLERIAGLSSEEARAQVIAGVEREAQREATRLARKIEDEARERAERDALRLMVQASERVSMREFVETTVVFVALPSDEMKGRIIGREGRNIRALETTTGIDLIVDDTPQAILISSFDPLRREIARVAIERLIEDGRIHPAKIEEVVARVRDEIEALIEEEGNKAAFRLGISGFHPKLARLVGRMKYHANRGHNLLQHSVEVALLAGYMAEQVGGRADIGHRAGLLHEIGRADPSVGGHTLLASAEIAAKYGESRDVVQAIRSLHPDFGPKTVEEILLRTANRMSDNRPGARKENLDIFVERLRRLEALALRFPGVRQAYAIKAGKEVRVIVDASSTSDAETFRLSKEIAGAIERQLTYPGQIRVSVVRETRAVRFAV
jgi:ribonuclease Y